MFFGAQTVYAQAFQKMSSNPGVHSLVDKIIDAIVRPAVSILFVFAGLVFIWGVAQLIMNADDSAARTKGRDHILWGIIGMTIMVSAYSIIMIIGNTVGVDPFQ